MFDFASKLLKSDFLPHGYCYRWQTDVVWMHVVSDLLIALSYYFIPFALIYIVKKRGDLVYPWMFWLFGIFILACGTTHLMSIWVIWQPVYRLDGVVKLITALASVPTAILLMRLAPAVIAIPSPDDLRKANSALEREVNDRRAAEEQVRALNAELEQRVEERTQELAAANAELRESENRLQAILNTSPTVIYVKDLEGRYTFVNRKFLDMFGLQPEQAIGKTDHDLFPSELAESYRALDQAVMESGTADAAEEIAYDKGEERTFVSTKFPLFRHTGDAYAICGISLDISERKRAEQALRNFNQELGQFAHIAAHDLREPLRTVKSYTQLLARRYAGRLDPDADDFIRFITGGVERMQLLIDDLNSYSEVAHRQQEEREPLTMKSVLDETLRVCSAGLNGSNCELTVSDLPVVYGNRAQLGQLLQNLISNAVKYRGKDRRLRLDISARRVGKFWEFRVKDNGIGFDMAFAELVFGLFKRLHSSEYPGTGIGLAICKKIVESHGGSIWAESEPNEGAAFYFTLPAVGA